MQIGNALVPMGNPLASAGQRRDQAAHLTAEKNGDTHQPSTHSQAAFMEGHLLEYSAVDSKAAVGVVTARQKIVSGYVIASGASLTAKQAIASYISNTFQGSGGGLRRTGGIDIFV